MTTGTCPSCKGSGTEPRPEESSFKQLCRRCQGFGITELTEAERSDNFNKRQSAGWFTVEQSRAAVEGATPRVFESGVSAAEYIRARRDEIRREEKRFIPPWEPKPDAAEPLSQSAAPCTCGMSAGADCDMTCSGVW